ncbi:MAG: amidohydrolase family protein [Anaerolineaceae bacterium]
MTERMLLNNAHLPGKSGLFSIGIHTGEIETVIEMEDTTIRGTESIDLDGAFILPGLWDSHLHLELLTSRLHAIDCEAHTKWDCLDEVQKAANSTDDNRWLIGFNWNHNIWEPAEYGTAQELDSVSGNHPVLLFAKSLHACWVNSATLSLAGITNDTPDPVGGEILRDASGQPTGVLLENAMGLVNKVIPPLRPHELADQMRSTQTYLHSLGLTGVHDFDRFESFEALRMLTERGERTLEVVKNLPADAIDQILEHDFRDELSKMGVTPGWIKAFADGALGPQSAAMIDPYENSTNYGLLLLHPEEILELGLKAAKAGWPLAIHAIGDSANQTVLDGFELLRQAETKRNLPHLRHRVEHVQCLRQEDFKRFGELDIIASVQPIHFPSDQEMARRYWGKRNAFAYAYRSLHEEGAELVFGSDAPVESPNPFLGMQAAVYRPNELSIDLPKDWPSSQSLPLSVVLEAYTLAPAKIAGLGCVGQILPGHLANLITLPVDPFKQSPAELGNIKPLHTFVRGKLVYSAL